MRIKRSLAREQTRGSDDDKDERYRTEIESVHRAQINRYLRRLLLLMTLVFVDDITWTR